MKVSANTRLAAVLGYPVKHSKSPALHNAAFAAMNVDAVYLALEVAPSDLATVVAGLSAANMLGASITVPHKTEVMRLCDSLSEGAQAIGAVNTLVRTSEGILCGHNTDAPGFVRAFRDGTGAEVQDRRVVVLGGGGAARAVAYGVTESSASSVEVIARSPNKVTWTNAKPWTPEVLSAACKDCDLLIDCTSMGLNADSETSAPAEVPVSALPDGAIVSTLVYHRKTALLQAAESRGLVTMDGAGMLLFQGAIAFELWTGNPAPIEAMRQALV